MNKSVTIKKPVSPETGSVESFISQAIQQNVPVETLERLFALREKVNAERAKAAYVQAMADFQSQCPVIKKTKKVLNKDGKSVRYMFAPLDSIVEQIQKPLASAQISYRWETKQEKGSVTAICYITHVMGHTESSDFTVETDSEAYMTNPQKTASALTFAKRYTLCNALGISTGDEDTDATDVRKESDAKSDKSKIVFRLRTLNCKTGTKEDIEKAVKELTELDLVETNYPTIADRLQVLIEERNENN